MMASSYVTVLDRELHYTEWGSAHTETIVMWHGLARTGRDFDDIAAVLSQRYRVLCPDTIGRGLSQWSPQPESEYSIGFYTRLAETAEEMTRRGRAIPDRAALVAACRCLPRHPAPWLPAAI